VSYDNCSTISGTPLTPSSRPAVLRRRRAVSTGIFVASDGQRRSRRVEEAGADALQQPILVSISEARAYPADESHQDYYLKHPVQYRYYRWSCGRDTRLQQIWGT
jgi:peptide-methionine (S)-S-oxide reductase